MQVRQRDIWLADLREPVGSEAGYLRPVIVLQADDMNVSRLTTYLVAPLTSMAIRISVPWNFALSASTPGLTKASIAQTNLLLTVNERQLAEHLGRISLSQLRQLFACLDIALGRT